MTNTQTPRPRGPVHQIISGRVEQLMRTRVLHASPSEEPGRARRSGIIQTGPWNLDLEGHPAGLTTAVLFDNTLAYALRLSDPTITAMVTTELQLNFLADLPAEDTELTAWTSSLYNQPSGGATSGILVDADGTEIVQATGWFHKVPTGRPEAQVQFERNTRLPLGPDTTQPVGKLLRANPSRIPGSNNSKPGSNTGLSFGHNPELANPHGNLHGGALAMMAGLASQQAMPDRKDFRMQSLRVSFVRPGIPGDVQSRVEVRHAGRTLRVVDVELHGESRKPYIIAQASFSRL